MHHAHPNIRANISQLFGCICAKQLVINQCKQKTPGFSRGLQGSSGPDPFILQE